MLGRERELQEVRAALAAARAGQGRLLLLAGETGVGKTRLAEAAIAVDGLAVLRGIASQRGAAPYAPIAAALRGFLRRAPDGLAELGSRSRELGMLLPELGPRPRKPEREALVQAIRLAFEAVARAQPTVVFLDDLQWADAATLELLGSLAGSAEEWPLLLLGAYRSEEIPRGHPLRRLRTELRRAGRLAELVLEPLDPSATAALAARVLGAEPGSMLSAALFDRTQGVPFFVEELAAALKAGSFLVEGKRGLELEAGARVPLPETIRDVVRLRTEELSPDARSTLEAAATVGTRFELALLSALADDAGVGEALEHGLLVEPEPGVAAFRHDLVREAVYADTPWRQRRSLHAALAELLQARRAEPALVADHWLAAGERERARPLLLMAATRYCALHAYRDAASAGRAALELWPEGTDEGARLDVLDELGRCARLCGEFAEAARAWEELASYAVDDSDRLAETKRRLAAVYELQGAASRAVAARVEAAELFAKLGREAEAAAERLLVVMHLWSEAPGAARGLVARALQEAVRSGRGDLESRSLCLQGFMASEEGRLGDALELTRAALSAALAGNHVDEILDAYWSFGSIWNTWGEYPAAQAALTDAVTFCRIHDLHPDEQFCLSCLGIVLWNRGGWDEAAKISRAVLASAATSKIGRAHALCTLGLVSVARGATARARPVLRQSLAASSGLFLPATTCDCALGLALADEIDGTVDVRWRDFAAAAAEVEAAGHYAPGLRLAATFSARRGDAALVQACAGAAAEIANRFASAEVLAALAHILGEVALLETDSVRAAEQFEQALELFRDVDAPFERAHMQTRAGAALVAAGEREAGIERLVNAYRTFRKLGARPFWLQAAAELEALGEPVDRRLGRLAARDLENGGLTRRELEILRLVAVGRTNREIARDLFLSPRTVEMHVRHMLSKLDCRSRTEATGKAHELGLLQAPAIP
jgi:DNA-binding CsgD family transcriptional regulator